MKQAVNKRSDISARAATILLCILACLGMALRVAATLGEPMGVNTFSDDNGYLGAGITFLKTGYVTYADPAHQSSVLGAGMPLLLSGLFAMFGYQRIGLLLSHIVFSAFGVASGIGAYLWGKLLHSRKVGVLAAAFVMLDISLISTNSAFYTEKPYTCYTLFALYLFVTCVQDWSWKRYLAGAVLFCAAASLKGLAFLTPVCVLPYLWAHRIPLRKWLPKAALLFVVFALVFLPWCVRNKILSDSFTPFPISQGDQKLLGTYDGIGAPVGDYASDTVELDAEAWNEGYQADALRRLARRGERADERYAQWLSENPFGFLITHVLIKPFSLLMMVFYPVKLFGVPERAVKLLWWGCLALAALGAVLPKRSNRKQCFLFPLIYVCLAVFCTAMYVPIGRYNVAHMPLIMVYSAVGAVELLGRLVRLRAPSKPIEIAK